MHTKRISSGYGKKPKWIVTPRPGPHKREESIPLLIVVRDILKYADTAREAKRIIHDGLIMVDKRIRKDERYGVGLMDTIDIPKIKKSFRVLPSKKGLILREIPSKESSIKPCKIMNKTIIKNGSIQLNLHDGSNIITDKTDYRTRDTLLIELPERKIKDGIEFKKGNIALIVHGRHSGEIGEINEISEGTATKKSITRLGEIQTLTDYIFVIGKKKPVITI